MKGKHAYLIMAHNQFDILIEILKELDHPRNDIFLHVDIKAGDYPKDKIRNALKHSVLYLLPRLNVAWGGYSQINCELRLIEQATNKGHYEYYHLMTGATFPLKTAEEILAFFDARPGKQFIGYTNQKDCSWRVKHYQLFNEMGKTRNWIDQMKADLRGKFNTLQEKCGYVRKAARGIDFKKGFVYWALTDDAVRYTLMKEEDIQKIYKHSFCGDELFMQTLIYHSPYRDQIYDYENEYNSCQRYCKPVRSWESAGNAPQANLVETSISVDDVLKCIKSNRLFGFKFVNLCGLEAIDKIRTIRKEL